MEVDSKGRVGGFLWLGFASGYHFLVALVLISTYPILYVPMKMVYVALICRLWHLRKLTFPKELLYFSYQEIYVSGNIYLAETTCMRRSFFNTCE